ncbi:MAG: hypothetical protein WCR93_00315 [Bacilli bacterium]
MKKVILLLILISFFIITVFKVDASKITFPLIGKIIVIDPGHGGTHYPQHFNILCKDSI